jgi:superoxide dismutase, Fe-Mn family
MKTNYFIISLISFLFFSCKKDRLVEFNVDVPTAEIEQTKAVTGNIDDVKAIEGTFRMFKLPFTYKALVPNWSANSVEIHYAKHHLSYVNALNNTIKDTKLVDLSLIDILKSVGPTLTDVRNNAGGFYNHNFYWESITPTNGSQPDSLMTAAIDRDFGSMDDFRTQFIQKSNSVFSSGWTWLVSDKTGKLSIVSTTNNDNPMMKTLGFTGIPLMTIDMWEHAYYIRFQNRKTEYVNVFLDNLNWDMVCRKYNEIPNKMGSRPIGIPSEIKTSTIIKEKSTQVIPTEIKIEDVKQVEQPKVPVFKINIKSPDSVH